LIEVLRGCIATGGAGDAERSSAGKRATTPHRDGMPDARVDRYCLRMPAAG